MAASLPLANKAVRNKLSRHDNRHALQNCGEYFGQGLGKKIEKSSSHNQHRSDNHTSWGSQTFYLSTYRHGYGNEGSYSYGHKRTVSADPRLQSTTLSADPSHLSKFHILTKQNFRRFPHEHSVHDNLGSVRSLDLVSTMLWYSNDIKERQKTVRIEPEERAKSSKETGRFKSYTTPLEVLAATQQPFRAHNPWKFSYKQ